MLLSIFLTLLVVWWLVSYMIDYECHAIDRLYYRIRADKTEVTDPYMVAVLLVGGPIRLIGEMLKERSQNRPKK